MNCTRLNGFNRNFDKLPFVNSAKIKVWKVLDKKTKINVKITYLPKVSTKILEEKEKEIGTWRRHCLKINNNHGLCEECVVLTLNLIQKFRKKNGSKDWS